MGDILSNSQLQNAMDSDLIQDLSDDDQSGAVDTDVLDEVIEQAEGTVNLYVARQYTLDSLSAAAKTQLRRLVTSIAIYDLYTRRMDAPAAIERRYQEAHEVLNKIAEGLLTLDDNATKKASFMNDQPDDRLFNFYDDTEDDFQEYP